MPDQTATHELLATVDVHELQSLPWGPMRWLFPTFVDEIELARFLKTLLSGTENRAVAIEPHRDSTGRPSTHVYDVFRVEQLEPLEDHLS
jgi:hypothetical protein